MEEVHQPPGFEDCDHPNLVYQLHEEYGLKQPLQAWYEKLGCFLISHGYVRGHVDKNIFH